MAFRGYGAVSGLFGAFLFLSVSTAAWAATDAADPTPAPVAGDHEPAGGSIWDGFSATLTAVTDYRDRGVTQSDEHPAIQGSIDWAHDSGLYLGVWASNVDFNDGGEADYELDIYAGFTTEWAGFEWDAMVNDIMYPGASDGLDYDLVELSLAASRDFTVAKGKALVIYSPDNSGDSGTEWYTSLQGEVPIKDTGLSVTGSFGYQYVDDAVRYGLPSYVDWSAGLSYSFHGFDLGLKYVDTNLSHSECATGCDATVIFSVGRTFGGDEG